MLIEASPAAGRASRSRHAVRAMLGRNPSARKMIEAPVLTQSDALRGGEDFDAYDVEPARSATSSPRSRSSWFFASGRARWSGRLVHRRPDRDGQLIAACRPREGGRAGLDHAALRTLWGSVIASRR